MENSNSTSIIMKRSQFLIAVFLVGQIALAQNPATDTLNCPQYKNALKGSFYFVPPIFFITGVSFGYERHITRHSTLELSSFYFVFYDKMGLFYHNLGFFPAYKYFIVSKKKA